MTMHLLNKELEGFGTLKVVASGDVERMTKEGWTLLAVVGTQEIVTHNGQWPAGVVPGQYGGQSCPTMTPVVVNASMFLMGMNKESVIFGMRKEIDGMVMAMKTKAKENEDMSKLLAEERRARKEIEEDRDIVRGQMPSVREKNIRLENDIAKIREAIGSVRLQEILREEAKKNG